MNHEKVVSTCRRVLTTVMGGALVLGAWADVPLPHGYAQLEWIQSDGSQYLDTEYTHQTNSRVVASFALPTPQIDAWAAVFGYRDDSCNRAFLFTACTGSLTEFKPAYVRDVGSDINYGSTAMPGETRINLECDGLTARWSVAADPTTGDSFSVKTAHGSLSAGTGTMTLFGCRQGTRAVGSTFRIKLRLFAFDIYEGEEAKRKFVPCRSLEGEVGLWDLVEGKFYGDDAKSAKRFLCPSDQGFLVNYLKSTGTQYIDTGYQHQARTRVTADFLVSEPQKARWSAIFGARDGNGQNYLSFFINNGVQTVLDTAYYYGSKSTTGPVLLEGTRISLDCCCETATWVAANNPATTNVLTVAPTTSTGACSLYAFALRSWDHYEACACVKLYDMRIFEGDRIVRDFRPYRQTDGRVGLYDFADHRGEANYEPFYTNSGKGEDFAWEYAYTTNGATLCIQEGTLAADGDFLGFQSVEKKGARTLAAAARTGYPALKLSEGIFSLRDGVAGEYTVDGALTLTGGAVIELDLTRDGCDSLTASSVDVEGASAANPVVLHLVSVDSAGLDSRYPIFRGTGLVPSDSGKFAVVGVADAALMVEDGVLYVLYSDPNVPVTSVWTGASATDPTNVLDPANWASTNALGIAISSVPTGATSVRLSNGVQFNCPAETPLVFRELILPAKLTADCNWCGVTAPMVGTLDLNGHRLCVSSLMGEATITDSGYQRLEWAASTSGGNQYVDACYKIRETDTITAVMNVARNQASTGATAFGSQMPTNPWNNSCSMDVRDNTVGKYRLWRGTITGCSTTGTAAAFYGTKNLVQIDPNGLSWKPVDAVAWTQTLACSPAGDCVQNMFVFAHNSADADQIRARQFAEVKIYSLRITNKDGEVVCDLVPARRLSDGMVGLMDIAGSVPVFRQNEGETALSAGPAMPWDDNLHISAGELHVAVPSGVELVNSTVALTGSLKLVKEGEGVYVSAKTDQAYSGGNDVVAGTFRCGDRGFLGIYGSSSTCSTIREGATLDLNGFGNHGTGLSFVLDGGCITNGIDRNQGTWNSLAQVSLTKDSVLAGFGFGMLRESYLDATLDLNGHTLYFDITASKTVGIYLMNTNVRGGGRLVGRDGGGTLQLGGDTIDNGKFVNAPDVILEMRDVAISDLASTAGQLVFGGYESAYAGTIDTGTNSLEVAGTFKPALGAKWHNVLLKDGATLDLSEQTCCLTNVCQFANDQRGVISFATNATITVDLGTQCRIRNGKILDWTNEPPADYTQVNFVRREGVDYRIYAGDDGLYVEKCFVIFLR